VYIWKTLCVWIVHITVSQTMGVVVSTSVGNGFQHCTQVNGNCLATKGNGAGMVLVLTLKTALLQRAMVLVLALKTSGAGAPVRQR